MNCTLDVCPEIICPERAVATVDGVHVSKGRHPVELDLRGELLCESHLWDLYRYEVEAGHADRIPGIRFLD